MNESNLLKLSHWLEDADSLLISAGAGMGVDSGLPDFRGNDGFWRAYPALESAGLSFIEIADPSWFVKNPRLAWGFYGHRLELYRKTLPHYGFSLINRWRKSLPKRTFVFTSNVDGQFQVAGFNSESIYECHGSIHFLQCSEACKETIWSADQFIPKVDLQSCLLINDLPICPTCRAVARPNILMFDDSEWLDNRCKVQEVQLQEWMTEVERPLVFEIGAGTTIPSVRDFNQLVREKFKSNLIRINPREFQVFDNHSVGISLGALEGLREVDLAFRAG